MWNKFKTWTPVILLIVSFVSSVCIGIFESIKYENYEATEAVVSDISDDFVKIKTARRYTVYYTYTINDTKYVAHDLIHEDNLPDMGELCTIWVDSSNYANYLFFIPKNFIIPLFISVCLAFYLKFFRKRF